LRALGFRRDNINVLNVGSSPTTRNTLHVYSNGLFVKSYRKLQLQTGEPRL